MTKSQVFLAKVSEDEHVKDIQKKVALLFDAAGFAECVGKNDLAAIKIHFGEKGNEGHINPRIAKAVSDKIKALDARPYFTDTNTLYTGRRSNTHDHLLIAEQHGYSIQKLGAPVIIADGLRGQNQTAVRIEGGKHFQSVRIATDFLAADALIVLTHVTGHLAAGYGGAIKNVGMGCAARAGKLAQHSDILPEIIPEKCTACGACAKWCPEHAILIEAETARVNKALCIACGQCLAVCPAGAVRYTWGHKSTVLNERMAEHALGALKDKKHKSAFMNFIIKFTGDCDCMGKKQDRLIPDIGILASRDIVAIDRASIDMVNEAARRDIFKEINPHLEYISQITHAQHLGLGLADYTLTTL